MPVEVTARHMEGAREAKSYAESKANKLIELFPRVEYVHVVLDVEKHRHEAEVVVQAKNRIRVEASESSDDMHNSIDVAVERAEKQLRKLREKKQEHRMKPGDEKVLAE